MKSLRIILTTLAITVFTVLPAVVFPSPNLSMDLSASTESAMAGDSVSFTLGIENSAFSTVATNTVVTINLPAGSTDIASQDCSHVDATTMLCALVELAPGEKTSAVVSAILSSEGHNLATASGEVDDPIGGTVSIGSEVTEIVAVEVQAPDLSPVDLEIELSFDRAKSYAYWDTRITPIVRNIDDTSTALFPVVSIELPDSFEFVSSNSCSASGQLVTCRVQALAPQSEAEASMVVNATELNDAATIVATVGSTQPELQPQNNASQVVRPIGYYPILCGASNPQCAGVGTTDSQSPASTDEASAGQTDEGATEATSQPETGNATDAAASPANSGGGALPVTLALLLLLVKVLVVLSPLPKAAGINVKA